MTTTWSQTAKNAHAVLSNGDLTVTTDGASFTNFLGRAVDTSPINVGDRKYWEVTINAQTSAGTNGVGIMNALGITDSFLGQTANSLSYFGIAGNIQFNGGSPATLGTFANGDVISVEIDEVAKLIRFRVNGGAPQPAGGIDISPMSGPIFPAYNLQTEDANDQQTTNFGATALAFTPTAGFTPFDGIPAPPVVVTSVGGGFRHVGRSTRDELEPEEEAVTEATTEVLPTKPPSRKMRKRLAAAKKQPAPPPVDNDEEEEAMMIGLAA